MADPAPKSLTIEESFALMDKWAAEEEAKKKKKEETKEKAKAAAKSALEQGAEQGLGGLNLHAKDLLDQIDD